MFRSSIMNKKRLILFILLELINKIICLSSNSYYLIDIDKNLSLNNSYCSNKLINKNLYRIPNQCHKHLLCNRYHCDDKSFRCIKIRETLCCLYKYIEKYCQKEYLKDQFRLIYFHISIQHGYCEINLERIEQNDQTYCISNYIETKKTTISQSYLSLKYFHHHLTTKLSNINYLRYDTTTISSKSSFIYTNFIIVLLSILL
ncbi:unnamed protein product [Rotaria sordida]|uniref:Uncharacterized protein n=2 Tax=Rotaria sordida TaxID=392033 RepID=A0A814UKH7_9BILA|nr:unnamed protein product [Rotaria sordida]CAF1431464.1 unnamed protein product [Rotaria sordida]